MRQRTDNCVVTKTVEKIEGVCVVLCLVFFIVDNAIERNIVAICWFGLGLTMERDDWSDTSSTRQ